MGNKSFSAEARHYKKKRLKAGQKPLENSGKRNIEQMTLLVLETIHDQCIQGAIKQDILCRCQLNQYYVMQILTHLLSIQAITQLDQADDNEIEHTKYFLTQKGNELYERIKEEQRQLGFTPEINRARVKIY